MTEDVAHRSIDWLHDHGCRVLALMGGEPLLRPDFVHKVVIGIGAAVTRRPLPHHRAYGSVHGGSRRLR
jgi:hypothetical protein